MHLKAIPGEAISFAEHNKWLLLGGAAVLVAGYLYVQHQGASASAGGGSLSYGDPMSAGLPSTTLSTFGAASGVDLTGGTGQVTTATDPTTTNVGSISPASGLTDPSAFVSTPTAGVVGTVGTGTPATTGTPLDLLTQLQFLTENNDYSFMMQQLKDTTDIAFANANLAALSLASANFSTSAFLASTFLNSPDQAAALNVVSDLPGASFAFTGVQFQNSNKNGFDNNLVTMLNNGTIANAIATVIPHAVQQPLNTQVAPTMASTPQGFTPTPVVSPTGSITAAPVSSSVLNIPTAGYTYSAPPVPAFSGTGAGGGGGGGGGTEGARLQMS